MRWFAKRDAVLWGESTEKNSRMYSILGWLGALIGISVGLLWRFHLPTVGKAGLALALGATLMPLIWEKAKVPCKMLWIAMLFLMLWDEYRTIDRDHRELVDKETTAFNIANQTAEDAHLTLAGVGALPKIISDTEKDLMAAEKQHNPTEAAKLRTDLKALERQRVLEITVELHQEMQEAAVVWQRDDYFFETASTDNHRRRDGSISEEEREQAEIRYTQKRYELNLGLTRQYAAVLTKANEAREALSLLVPSHDQKENDLIFAKAAAGQPIDWLEIQSATLYLDNLYRAAIK
jgi:hypothetical protein